MCISQSVSRAEADSDDDSGFSLLHSSRKFRNWFVLLAKPKSVQVVSPTLTVSRKHKMSHSNIFTMNQCSSFGL